MNTPALLLLAASASVVLFLAVHFLSRAIRNFGAGTVAWAYALAALAAFYAVFGSGWPARRALIGAMGCLWGLRLGSHLLRRVARRHPAEDERYRRFRQKWGAGFHRRMLGFALLQALSVVYLGLPFLLAVQNHAHRLRPLEITGLLVWLFALTGESLADRQLDSFLRKAENQNRLCAHGLWRWSRHPNYFFELWVWIGFCLFALPSPGGWLAVLSPLTVGWLLLRVSGVPPTEAESLQRIGDAYRRYQLTTSVLIPWPHRRPPANDSATTGPRRG